MGSFSCGHLSVAAGMKLPGHCLSHSQLHTASLWPIHICITGHGALHCIFSSHRVPVLLQSGADAQHSADDPGSHPEVTPSLAGTAARGSASQVIPLACTIMMLADAGCTELF